MSACCLGNNRTPRCYGSTLFTFARRRSTSLFNSSHGPGIGRVVLISVKWTQDQTIALKSLACLTSKVPIPSLRVLHESGKIRKQGVLITTWQQ